jgi:hypothetical protein
MPVRLVPAPASESAAPAAEATGKGSMGSSKGTGKGTGKGADDYVYANEEERTVIRVLQDGIGYFLNDISDEELRNMSSTLDAHREYWRASSLVHMREVLRHIGEFRRYYEFFDATQREQRDRSRSPSRRGVDDSDL